MAAAVHGVVRASLDADAIAPLRIGEAQVLQQPLIEEGYEAALRTGDVDDPIPGLLEINDRHGNRVHLTSGLFGMDPDLLDRTWQVRLAEARAVIELDRGSLDLGPFAFHGKKPISRWCRIARTRTSSRGTRKRYRAM